MQKLVLAALLGAAWAVVPCCAHGAVFSGTIEPGDGAKSFTFSGAAGGGIGSARMTIAVSDSAGITTIVADIWNTSPTTYGNGQTNVAAITGFGFDITDDKPVLTYSIVARQWNGSSFSDVVLGESDSADNHWDLREDGGSGKFAVDLFADNGNGIAEGLYNPQLAGNGAIGNTSPYFTGARLVVTFEGPQSVNWTFSDQPGDQENGSYVTPFVRMQRVGNGGSLKLDADGPPFVNPEPQSLAIWALAGSTGLLFVLRRRKRAALIA